MKKNRQATLIISAIAYAVLIAGVTVVAAGTGGLLLFFPLLILLVPYLIIGLRLLRGPSHMWAQLAFALTALAMALSIVYICSRFR